MQAEKFKIIIDSTELFVRILLTEEKKNEREKSECKGKLKKN